MQTSNGAEVSASDGEEVTFTGFHGQPVTVQIGSFYRSTGTPTEQSREYAHLCLRLTGRASNQTLPCALLPLVSLPTHTRWLIELALRRGVTETAACAQGLYWHDGPATSWDEICDVAQWLVASDPSDRAYLRRTLRETKAYAIQQREELAEWLKITRPFPGVHGPAIDAARARREQVKKEHPWLAKSYWVDLRRKDHRPLLQAYYDRLEASPAENWTIPDLAVP